MLNDTLETVKTFLNKASVAFFERDGSIVVVDLEGIKIDPKEFGDFWDTMKDKLTHHQRVVDGKTEGYAEWVISQK